MDTVSVFVIGLGVLAIGLGVIGAVVSLRKQKP